MEMSEPETPPPDKRPVLFKSKKQMKEEWAKLELPDLENAKAPTAEQTALDAIYQDDLNGLGNE
jgi:hypothetical protein